MVDEYNDPNSTELSLVACAIGTTTEVYHMIQKNGTRSNNYKNSNKSPLKYYLNSKTIEFKLTELKGLDIIRRNISTDNYYKIVLKYYSNNINSLNTSTADIKNLLNELKKIKNISIPSILSAIISIKTLSDKIDKNEYNNYKPIIDKIINEVIEASSNPEKKTCASISMLTLINNQSVSKEDILNVSRNIILEFIAKNEDIYRNFYDIYKNYNTSNIKDKLKNIHELDEDNLDIKFKKILLIYKSIICNENIEFKYLNKLNRDISINNSNNLFIENYYNLEEFKSYSTEYQKITKKFKSSKDSDLFIKKIKADTFKYIEFKQKFDKKQTEITTKKAKIYSDKSAKDSIKTKKEEDIKKIEEQGNILDNQLI
jgi:hypothetical protein